MFPQLVLRFQLFALGSLSGQSKDCYLFCRRGRVLSSFRADNLVNMLSQSFHQSFKQTCSRYCSNLCAQIINFFAKLIGF